MQLWAAMTSKILSMQARTLLKRYCNLMSTQYTAMRFYIQGFPPIGLVSLPPFYYMPDNLCLYLSYLYLQYAVIHSALIVRCYWMQLWVLCHYFLFVRKKEILTEDLNLCHYACIVGCVTIGGIFLTSHSIWFQLMRTLQWKARSTQIDQAPFTNIDQVSFTNCLLLVGVKFTCKKLFILTFPLSSILIGLMS